MGNNVGGLNYRTGKMMAGAENTALWKEQYNMYQAQNAYAFGDVYNGMYYEDQAIRSGERAERIHDRRWRSRKTPVPWAHGSVNTVNPATGVPYSPLGFPMYGAAGMGGMGAVGSTDMGTLPMIMPGMGPNPSNFGEYTQYMMSNAMAPTAAAPLWAHSATIEPPTPIGASSLAGPMMGNGMGMGMGGYW